MVGRKLLCILYQLSNLNLITYMYHFLKDNINTHAVNNRLHIEIHVLKSKLIYRS